MSKAKSPARKSLALQGQPTARDLALKALTLMDDGMPIQAAVDAVLSVNALAGCERRLCSELVYGCTRERIRSDFILSRLLRNPGKLPRPMLHALAIAVHCLVWPSRIPPHAAISEAVTQVERLYGRSLARVANGALRSLQRLGDAPQDLAWYVDPQDAPDQRQWQAQSRFWSLPLDICDLWRSAYGEDAALSLMRRSFERPWTGIRINARAAQARALRSALEAAIPESQRASLGPWGMAIAPGALPDEVLSHSLWDLRQTGALSFQSAGSQAAIAGLGLTDWAEPVWDACAGVGGKSLALLESGVDVRLASDLSASRLGLLALACAARVLAQPALALADAIRPPLAAWRGHILADVPCSGLGVLARRPDIRFPGRRSPEVLRQYAASQRRILKALAGRLEKGRQLAYITCTVNPQENEAVVSALLKERRDITLLGVWQTPLEHPWLEGMYGALLARR